MQVDLAQGGQVIVPVPADQVRVGDKLTVGVRPDDLRPSTGAVSLAFTPEVVERLGNQTVIYGTEGSGKSVCMVAGGAVRMPIGEPCDISFDPQDVHLFREDGSAFDRAVDLTALADLD